MRSHTILQRYGQVKNRLTKLPVHLSYLNLDGYMQFYLIMRRFLDIWLSCKK